MSDMNLEQRINIKFCVKIVQYIGMANGPLCNFYAKKYRTHGNSNFVTMQVRNVIKFKRVSKRLMYKNFITR